MKSRFLAASLSFIMPGLGQLFNKQIIKAILILILEHTINRLAHINAGLMLSFNGKHHEALQLINYEYALFYPGFYVFFVYDSVVNAEPNPNKNSAIFFILSGLLGTFGVTYGKYIPFSMITTGFIMILFMSVGTYFCSKSID